MSCKWQQCTRSSPFISDTLQVVSNRKWEWPGNEASNQPSNKHFLSKCTCVPFSGAACITFLCCLVVHNRGTTWHVVLAHYMQPHTVTAQSWEAISSRVRVTKAALRRKTSTTLSTSSFICCSLVPRPHSLMSGYYWVLCQVSSIDLNEPHVMQAFT